MNVCNRVEHYETPCLLQKPGGSPQSSQNTANGPYPERAESTLQQQVLCSLQFILTCKLNCAQFYQVVSFPHTIRTAILNVCSFHN
jgi:hypothetical protein